LNGNLNGIFVKRGRSQGDQARDERSKESYEVTAKEAKFTKKESNSEGFAARSNRLIAIKIE
jgi:hypothetical protein